MIELPNSPKKSLKMHSDIYALSGCETYKNSQIFCCIVQHPCQIFFDISDHFSKVFFLSSLSAFPMIYTSSFERPIAFLLQELFLYSFFLLFTLAKQSSLTVPTTTFFSIPDYSLTYKH